MRFVTYPVSWSLTVPTPPSVNALYLNRRRSAGAKGRMISPAYKAWKVEADAALWTQLPLRHFKGEVAICMAFGPTKGLSDLDGRIKATCDLLVHHNIIVDDNSKYVRLILAQWDDKIKGCKVTISSMSQL